MAGTGLSILFLSAGLFMGWSLGGNDAANIFGTAVGTKMVKFKTAAAICSIFVVLGATVSGAGASHTLGALGSIDAISGAFVISLSAALTVTFMTSKGLPVSTSQAIVGSIIAWNIHEGLATDLAVFYRIIGTWFFAPILGAFFAFVLYWVVKVYLHYSHLHIVTRDKLIRRGLLVAGAFGAYSLGANNIANVMGVFVKVSPFETLEIFSGITITSTQQLFFLGAIAISVGVITYSKRVMLTVGKDLFKLSPVAALVVVLASSLVLFAFSSAVLRDVLQAYGLPAFPLVPVSQSQAVVGAILGIGVAKGGRSINVKGLVRIAYGWVLTPLAAFCTTIFILYVK
jgi:PiT family inorganic phosphate transporter